jgi:tRNA pseudouridine55 synthase
MFQINKNDTDFLSGEIIAIDKPLNITSFGVVKKVRYVISKALNIKKIKVGHAGTLDPLATGLLIICTGKATKRITEFQDLDKEYVATFKFGATTPSFDLETKIDYNYPFEHIIREALEDELKSFIGQIEQVPPIFSAKVVNGERAYNKARQGEEIKLSPAKITIKSIEILDFELPLVTFKILCSKGTYIRALARDVGEVMKSGAHLVQLKRTKIGDIDVEKAFELEEFLDYVKKTKQKDATDV